ncbi:hypothetical protein KCTC52924_03405 [Arenibacter antarcticus]|uniref:Dabb family protein n=1 Tax=Arenibacter antarcticus TaxID=2040469 RepID=A0ABW5VIF9_9FLAO|nr:Dabb family protein [Arenibacter sp. H213]MCM4166473.1 stress responsive alpha-beta barrel domain-containing protein [Arenibacter sp. H213]
MIHHSVIFNLKHVKGSERKKRFFEAVKKLGLLPGVLNFKILKQTNSMNTFDYGISMDFVNQITYDNYSNNPEHSKFIEEYWSKDVIDFIEIDYEIYNP